MSGRLIQRAVLIAVGIASLLAHATDASPRQQSSTFESNVLKPVEETTANTETIQTRLRLTWGGSTAREWQGKIRFIDAAISNPTPLGFSLDSASSLHVESRQVNVVQKSASTFDGVDVDVLGGNATKIIIELHAPDEKPITQEFSLADVIAEAQICALDQNDNRFSVDRVPGDLVQFKTERQSLIFEPGETFTFSFRPNHASPDIESNACQLQVKAPGNSVTYDQLVQVDDGRHDKSGYQQASIQVPPKEGVYELLLTLKQRGSAKLLSKRSAMTREVQFVVVDSKRQRTPVSSYDNLVAEIDPAQLQLMMAQRDSLSRLIGRRNPNQAIGKYSVSADGASVKLPTAGWQAIPISIEHPNRPHVVEIEYPNGQPMSLGLSVLQPDESGQIPNFGFDSGFHIPDSIVGPSPTANPTTVHRFSFWPNEEEFVLLIANRSQSTDAQYQKIRVRESSQAAVDKADHFRQDSDSNRKFLVYYEQPLFAENFAVNKRLDTGLGQPITDWNTFYESANRLVHYLKDAGAGGAFINVFGEGSSLMPVESTLTTPRYDSGIFSSEGRDPIRKDVVELFYRVFEREGLVLVPVLSFDQPLSEIEFHSDDAVRQSSRIMDVRQRESGAEQLENLPCYIPLCRQVQERVTAVVQEISQRYSSRENYIGLAIACRPDTYTMLPGSRHGGYDQFTTSDFAASLPKTKMASYAHGKTGRLFAENHTAWLDWRTDRMKQWYEELAGQVVGGNDKAKLYLPLVDIFHNEEVASALSPSLYRATDVAEVMHKLGFAKSLNESSEISLMQPTRVAPIHPLSINKRESHLQNSGLVSEWFAPNRSEGSSLFSHRSAWARFENLEGSEMLPQQTIPILRLQQLHPGSIWNRERFARSLLVSDSRLMVDGGLLLNTNLDPKLKAFLDIFRALPDQTFTEIPHQNNADDFHPIAVRHLAHDGFVYLYCVNGSPWEITANVGCEKPTDEMWQALGTAQQVPLEAGADGKLQIKLAPFDLVGLKVRSDSINAKNFNYVLPPEAQRDLSTAFYRLRSRLVVAGNSPPIDVLQDSDFEAMELQRNWTFGEQQDSVFTVSSQSPFQGANCLKIDNQGDSSVWIRSSRFDPPVTGRLSVAVWLKIADVKQQPPLRISIESTDSDSNYYRFAEVGSLVEDRKQNQISNEWKRFAVHFDDVPQNKLAGLRVGFDMMGAGAVEVDRLEMYDRWLDESDQKSLTQAFASVGSLLQQPEKLERCRQMLNGYWPMFLREYFTEDLEGTAAVRSGILNEQQVAPAPRSSMRRRFRRFVSPKIFQFR